MPKNSASDNQKWVQDKIAERGLTKEIEAEAALIAQAREEMEDL